jgi:succinate dehydrogenase / fumarate reductase cytochrome b subunit
MEKRYAFFPGCVLTKAAAEAHTAIRAVAGALGVELVEIPGWNCCGASHVQDVEPLAALAANARNLALAEQIGAPLLTACSTCALMLRQAKAALDGGRKDEINVFLKAGKLTYNGTVPVTMLLWELAKDLPALKAKVKKPLGKLQAAAFYGCHTVRPEAIMDFENSQAPKSFESVLAALGATPAPFAKRLSCCGFHAVHSAEADALKMTSEIVDCAAKAGAHCVVTPCPLCQMQLDMYLDDAAKATGIKTRVPTLHLQQVVGLALGIPGKERGLERNIVELDALKSIGLV